MIHFLQLQLLRDRQKFYCYVFFTFLFALRVLKCPAIIFLLSSIDRQSNNTTTTTGKKFNRFVFNRSKGCRYKIWKKIHSATHIPAHWQESHRKNRVNLYIENGKPNNQDDITTLQIIPLGKSISFCTCIIRCTKFYISHDVSAQRHFYGLICYLFLRYFCCLSKYCRQSIKYTYEWKI